MAEKIETLDDWNARLGCCCLMPECPIPLMECESKSAAARTNVFFYTDDEETPYLKRRREYASSPAVINQSTSYRIWMTTNFRTGSPFTTFEFLDDNQIFLEEHWSETLQRKCGIQTRPNKEEVECGGTRETRTANSQGLFQEGNGYHAFEDSVVEVDIQPVGGEMIDDDPEEVHPPCTFRRVTDYSWFEAFPDGGGWETVQTSSNQVVDFISFGTGVTAGVGDVILSESFTEEDLAEEVEGLLDGMDFGDCGSGCSSDRSFVIFPGSSHHVLDTIRRTMEASASASRIRFRIDGGHTGSWFKITFDLVFFPATGEPSFFEEDVTLEWEGPGDPESEDSWLTDWHEIPVPEEPGSIEVRNVRYVCYNSPYGTKPQTMGPAWQPPEPEE